MLERSVHGIYVYSNIKMCRHLTTTMQHTCVENEIQAFQCNIQPFGWKCACTSSEPAGRYIHFLLDTLLLGSENIPGKCLLCCDEFMLHLRMCVCVQVKCVCVSSAYVRGRCLRMHPPSSPCWVYQGGNLLTLRLPQNNERMPAVC